MIFKYKPFTYIGSSAPVGTHGLVKQIKLPTCIMLMMIPNHCLYFKLYTVLSAPAMFKCIINIYCFRHDYSERGTLVIIKLFPYKSCGNPVCWFYSEFKLFKSCLTRIKNCVYTGFQTVGNPVYAAFYFWI